MPTCGASSWRIRTNSATSRASGAVSVSTSTTPTSTPKRRTRIGSPPGLQGQSEHIGNIALVYEKYGFSGRLSYNYNGKSILEIGGDSAEDIWVDDHQQLDFLGRIQVSKKISLVLELINLTDEPYRVFEGTPDRPRQEEYYSWWGVLGVRFDL